VQFSRKWALERFQRARELDPVLKGLHETVEQTLPVVRQPFLWGSLPDPLATPQD
jgi:hypothetical protein